jgi:hypothetical protein
MHGVIHAGLKKFVEHRYGRDAWKGVLAEARLAGKMYLPVAHYPDAETVALVAAASKLTRTASETILEEFGEFLAPDLLDMYGMLVRPEWKTLELLLNTEETIHRIVRLEKPGAAPPRLRFEQVGPNQLRFTYDSPRKLAAVARGIIKGVAQHYGQAVTIAEHGNPDGSSVMTITIN